MQIEPATPSRLQEIADLAEVVADEKCRNGKVEPLEIAQSLGITTSFGHYGDAFDGMLEHLSGRFHIYCNLSRVERESSPRARFTLAHELGHFYIDEHRHALESGQVPKHPSECEFESKNPIEIEADHFAANLLLPNCRFRRRAESVAPGLTGILQLASLFGTSVTSTAIRFVQLEVAPAAIVKWSIEGEFAWKWLSTSVFAARYRRTLQSADKLPSDSATMRALRGDVTPSGQPFFRCGTTAASWFPSVSMGAESWNVLFVEEAIQLGRYGVLTLLYLANDSLPKSYHLL